MIDLRLTCCTTLDYYQLNLLKFIIGGGRDKSAPTDVLLQPLDFRLNRLFEMYWGQAQPHPHVSYESLH